MTNKDSANVLEIFSSIQGEGLYVGERHIFIRFHGCNLSCVYCDVSKQAKITDLDADDILEQIDTLNADSIHNTLVLTGGEPLLHSDFLKELLPLIADRGLKIYLETNGTLSKELSAVIDYVDIVAVDIKLPSVTGDKPCWQAHNDFIKVVFQKEFFIKVIVSDNIDMEDFDKAVGMMKEASFDIPFVIQPVTKDSSCQIDISAEKLLELQDRALRSLNRVLVIPQSHKMMEMR